MHSEEQIQKWLAADGITYDFMSAEIWADFPKLSVRLIDGRANVADRLDLCFRFDAVCAFTLNEEFIHPTQTIWGVPPAISRTSRNTFPILIVHNSALYLGLKARLDILFPSAVHYRLCTNRVLLDIISAEPPAVDWLKLPASAPPPWAA